MTATKQQIARRRLTPAAWWDVERMRLTSRRADLGMARNAAAARIGIDERTLAAWEAGSSEPSAVDWLHWRQALAMSTAPNLAAQNPLTRP